MKLTLQKRLAARVFKGSKDRVWFDQSHLNDIKDAITKEDIRSLIAQGIIREKPKNITSRFRARKLQTKKSKGLRRGHGSRKGRFTARLPRKSTWITRIRVQRKFIRELFDQQIISKQTYKDFYRKAKGGFFRSRRHIKLFLNDNNLALKK